MLKYWIKNRLLCDLAISIVLILLVAFFSILPIFNNAGESALAQSLYKNDKLNFDVPSPSYEQIAELENKEFIESVFPYFYTEVTFSINGANHQSRLFLSDSFNKLEQTMYCKERLIKKADKEYDNPLLVDYKFIKDTGLDLGSLVEISFGSSKVEFKIAAIYETNTYYDGGALMAKWEDLQKDLITAMSQKVVYSGAYIYATDYQQCKNYLEKEYKPYGRLRSESEFATHEAYVTHYEAFMAANYANEITDFTIKKQDVTTSIKKYDQNVTMYTVIACVILLAFPLIVNFLLWFRGSERKYFIQQKLKGSKNIGFYYIMSILMQTVLLLIGVILSINIISSTSKLYIPMEIVQKNMYTFILSIALSTILIIIENMLFVRKTK